MLRNKHKNFGTKLTFSLPTGSAIKSSRYSVAAAATGVGKSHLLAGDGRVLTRNDWSNNG